MARFRDRAVARVRGKLMVRVWSMAVTRAGAG